MFLEFLFPLVRFFTPFNVFQYTTFRAAYASVTALLACLLFGPMVIRRLAATQARMSVRADVPANHLKKIGTPTMGGLLIIGAILISVLLWMDIRSPYTWLAVLSVVGFGTIGFIDDYIKIHHSDRDGLRAWVKLLIQACFSAVLAILLYIWQQPNVSLIYVPFIKDPLFDLSLFYIPFAIFMLLATSNAVNLTDGLDGLATGLVIMVAASFTVLSYLAGRFDYSEYLQIPFIRSGGELAILCLIIVGACVGFLWFNTHPAEIIMGDTGSLALGGTIGLIALMIKKEILLGIVGGVFVIEAISVILQVVVYKYSRRRLFLMAPLHHHFELKGWPESKVVARFWILGGLFAILSLSTLKIQ